MVVGDRAAIKANRHGQAVLDKTARMLAARQQPPFSRTELQIIGAEGLFGDFANPALDVSREVVLRLCIQHPLAQSADLFSREFIGAALSMAPGLTLLSPGRPKVSPVVRLYSFLLDRNAVEVKVEVDGIAVAYDTSGIVTAEPPPAETSGADAAMPAGERAGELVEVALRQLAVARSGDKGDKANIGVIARDPAYLDAIRAGLSTGAVAARFSHLSTGRIERFDLPGIHAINFLLHDALGGGGAASIRLDPQAKTFAQILLDTPIALDKALAKKAAGPGAE